MTNLTNLKELNVNKYREWPDMLERIYEMKHNAMVWNWGAEAFTSFLGKFLQFKVYGRHFEGWICIGVNAIDLLDVFFVDSDQNIAHVIEDVNIQDLLIEIDDAIQTKRSIFSISTQPS